MKLLRICSTITAPIDATRNALATGSIGISILQFSNMNSPRNVFVIGFSIFMALSVPQYFKEYTTTAGHGPSHSRAHWVLQISSHHSNFIISFPP